MLSSGARLDGRTTWAARFRTTGVDHDPSFAPVAVAREGRDRP
ncbi:hypothetical protein [Kitasatospora sp. A2-31]|nr:hypothetical protein [Kitasatospora sp. A2-31]